MRNWHAVLAIVLVFSWLLAWNLTPRPKPEAHPCFCEDCRAEWAHQLQGETVNPPEHYCYCDSCREAHEDAWGLEP